MRTAFLAFFILLQGGLVGVFAIQGNGAASFLVQHEKDAKQNPAGVTFNIRLKDGRKQFRPGEVIELELLLSSSVPKRYSLNANTHTRTERLDVDSYHLDPSDGASDPLEDYFNEQRYSFTGGGLIAIDWLGEKPSVITRELNEWFRFDRPGKYRLYLTTRRVGLRKEGRADVHEAQPLSVASNILEFEILPFDGAWANRSLREIVSVMDDEGQQANRTAACRALRFLGTAGAAREMARRFRGLDQECDGEFMFGLVGSPHRALVISEMEQLLEAPEHPVSEDFLQTLSLLSFVKQNPDELPPYPNGEQMPERLAAWQRLYDARIAKQDEVTSDYLRRLTTALAVKRGRAQAVSFHTILEISMTLPPERRVAGLAAARQRVAGLLPALVAELSPEAQSSLLESYWEQIAGTNMLPVLRRLYEAKGEGARRLRELALQRIYEVAPDEGRALILSEARSPRPRVGMHALGLLPERELPELDEALAGNLEQQFDDIQAALVERYASPAVAGRVRAAYGDRGGKMACAIQAPLLAYFLRVAPAMGEELVRQALAARSPSDSRCYDRLLDDVPALYTSPELERIALETLADENIEMVAHAANMLGRYGSKEAEEPLWRRFQEWHDAMQGRAAEMKDKLPGTTSLGGPELGDEAMAESALRGALSHSSAWLAGPEKLRRMGALCLTRACQQEVKEWASTWTDPVSVRMNTLDGVPGEFYVVQYSLSDFTALKEKLSQFPQGTSFKWEPNTEGARERQLFMELKSYLEGRGLRLQR